MSAEFILYWTALCSTIFVPLSNSQLWLLRPSAEKAHLIIVRGCSYYKEVIYLFSAAALQYVSVHL